MKKLSVKSLKEVLEYNPNTGLFTWLGQNGSMCRGELAGSLKNTGYIMIGLHGKYYSAHRLAWLYMEGYIPIGIDIDHINRDSADNRWENLRLISKQCNARNCKVRTKSISGITGIIQHYGKWEVKIKINGKLYYLGLFTDFDEAVLTRLAAEQCLNWEGCNSTSSAFLYAKKNNLILSS